MTLKCQKVPKEVMIFLQKDFVFSSLMLCCFPSGSCWALSLFLLSYMFLFCHYYAFAFFPLRFFREDFVSFCPMYVCCVSQLVLVSCACVSTPCESGIMFEYGCLSHCCHFFPRESAAACFLLCAIVLFCPADVSCGNQHVFVFHVINHFLSCMTCSCFCLCNAYSWIILSCNSLIDNTPAG